ncbi:diaminopimelate epimerase [Coxiella-like endosymbiont of Rhipicephalus sanguineus]|uniref:diaminopimelate epimerase n=1 Tax=Coxiella-like endosymbiont of Rhipicephalus sanguineus TaxID=1955402 RepID=UPI00203F3AD2|nr:diaminopimelate epimerase [Coxiella-like endosymbiont of Rhipicephalus sanguineus]MBT8506731.1 diaminopimelate epimerase [Coxiella-like endosymbiont of Rhipicephalus sanguineus]
MKINFTKMHGLGNDFVVIDATKQPFQMTTSQIQKMANRRLGVGFDQLLVIELPKDPTIDFHFRIFNTDGSEVSQCGNGARCIARYIRANQLTERDEFRVSTLNDILELKIQSNDKVSVKMGVPRFDPTDIPFIAPKTANFYDLEIDNQKIKLGVVNIGNPHAIIPVNTIDALQVSKLGPQLSIHERFPEGTNVGFMQVINAQNIRLRVYERGAEETLACGSGACAAVAVGRRSGLLQERVVVNQPGGSLIVDWQGPLTPVIMTGPTATVFCGEWSD